MKQSRWWYKIGWRHCILLFSVLSSNLLMQFECYVDAKRNLAPIEYAFSAVYLL